jgi:hypothetical protein
VKKIIILLVLALASCKTTKRIERESFKEEEKTEEVLTVETSSVNISDDTVEVITEKITTTNSLELDINGNSIIVPNYVIDRKIQKRAIKKETTGVEKITESTTAENIASQEYDLDRETEGQEVVKDLTKGITEGVFKSIFGNFFTNIAVGLMMLVFVVIMVIRMISKSKASDRDQLDQ